MKKSHAYTGDSCIFLLPVCLQCSKSNWQTTTSSSSSFQTCFVPLLACLFLCLRSRISCPYLCIQDVPTLQHELNSFIRTPPKHRRFIVHILYIYNTYTTRVYKCVLPLNKSRIIPASSWGGLTPLPVGQALFWRQQKENKRQEVAPGAPPVSKRREHQGMGKSDVGQTATITQKASPPEKQHGGFWLAPSVI